MSEVSRRLSRVLAATTLLVVCPALIVSIPAGIDDNCTALRRFAEAYVGTSPTLDQLAQFDRAHRIAIFNAVAPAVRADLWREQLRRFELRADLSDVQRAFVHEIRATITPAAYEQPAPARRESARHLWARAAPLFPSVEQRRAWFDLGAVTINTSPRTPSIFDRLASFYAAGAQDVPYCECSAAYGGMECYPGGCVSSFCTNWLGCGPVGWDWCAGMCSY